MATLAWIGNAALILGLLRIGRKDRRGFLAYAIGELFWIMYGWYNSDWPIVFIGVVFTFIAVTNYLSWQDEPPECLTYRPFCEEIETR